MTTARWKPKGFKCFFILFFIVVVLVIAALVMIQKPVMPEKETMTIRQLSQEEIQEIEALVDLPEEISGDGLQTPEMDQKEKEEPEEKPVPLSEEELKISDIYAKSGEQVSFKSYHSQATEYVWELYDLTQKNWIAINEDQISARMDELCREISVLGMNAQEELDGQMIRCSIKLSDGSEVVHTASLYLLDEDIADVQIGKIEADAGKYVNVMEIPTEVTFESGRKKTITGLNGLHFYSIEQKVEYEESISGNRVEKQLLTITELDYCLAETKARECKLRYVSGETVLERKTEITGVDKIEPVISSLTLSDYEISNEERIVPVDVEIIAEDNETPYPELKYAFVHENHELTDGDFQEASSFTVDIDHNGIWFACVKDNSGNIAKHEKQIYIVDQKAPILSLEMQCNNWCNKNVIVAIGEDKTELKYQIKCDARDIEGEWTSESSFPVKENGVYVITAMDAAGNITSEEITISNIDNSAPVINGITVGR